jgi:1,4-dihydroxy-2-naphthoate octaprenyltransferase
VPAPAVALAATRPRFLAASLLPVLVGTAWGWHVAGGLDPGPLVLALAATACLHAASNAWNDVGDELSGTDRANSAAIRPYTGGSGLIQSGAIDVGAMRRLALALAALAVALGGALAAWRGPGVLAFGAAGAALGAAYSAPGVRLAGRGLGEAAIAAAFGLLPVTGAAWLQSGRVDAGALLVALPVSAWIAAVIVANEIPDAPADGRTGKRTLAVRLGARTPGLHALLQIAAFAACLALAGAGLVAAWTVAGPALLLAGGLAASRALGGDRAALARGIRLTLAVHAAGCLWLLAALVAGP